MKKLGTFMFAFIMFIVSCNLFGPSAEDLPVPITHNQYYGVWHGDTLTITHRRQVFGIDKNIQQEIHGIALGRNSPKSLDYFTIESCRDGQITSRNGKPKCWYTWYVSPCRKDDEFIPHQWRPMSFVVSGNDTIFSKPGLLTSGWGSRCSQENSTP